MEQNQQSSAALIGAAIRRHLADPEWSWRYAEPRDEIDARAIETLRRDRDRAAKWCELVAEAIGMSLPVGNGTNGPWHRSAVLDASDHFGLLDIAAGRIAWTNVKAPRYVRRFAMKVTRCQSVSVCGESGAMGSAKAQIALTYGLRDAKPVEVSAPNQPSIISIEWGLQTCYGETGPRPSPDDFRKEWTHIMTATVEVKETETPQWDTTVMSVDADLAAEWLKIDTSRLPGGKDWHRQTVQSHFFTAEVRLRPCNFVGRVDIEVFGIGDDRRMKIAELRTEWETWIRAEAARRAAEAALSVLSRGKLSIPACGSTWRSLTERVSTDVRVQRHVLKHAAPPDPLTPDERLTVQECAGGLLSLDPVEVGLSLRSPDGRPGYPNGANHISYLLPSGTPHTDDILDEPGVRAWLAAVKEAAQEEHKRLRDHGVGESSPFSNEELDRLRGLGYTVELGEYGHIKATRTGE